MGRGFKGWSETAQGIRVDPLTLTDAQQPISSRRPDRAPDVEGTRPVVEASSAPRPALGLRPTRPSIRLVGGRRPDQAVGMVASTGGQAALHLHPRAQENGRLSACTAPEGSHDPSAGQGPGGAAAAVRRLRHHFNRAPPERWIQTPPADHYAIIQVHAERLEDPWYDARPPGGAGSDRSGETKWRGERVFIGEALSASWSA